MNNLEELWQKAGDLTQDQIELKSSDYWKQSACEQPLLHIRRGLLYTSMWAVLISGIYLWVFIVYSIAWVQAGIALLLAFNAWSLAAALKLRSRIPANLSNSGSLSETIELQIRAIRGWIRTNEYSGVVLYPVSVSTGFVLGGAIGSGKPVEVFMAEPVIILFFALSIAVLVPLCFLLTRWMVKVSFGKQLALLETQLRQLKME
jgi:hypothetical protein